MDDLEKRQLTGLMSAYQEGNLKAFERLYQQIRPVLLQYLLSRTFDRDWAEELTQEAFLQIHRSRRTYLRGRPVIPWAIAIARHVYLASRRARYRRGKHETLLDEILPELPVPPDLENSAEQHLIRRALTHLSGEQREAVLMHHVLGLTFQEISGVLGIGRSTAKLRAHRGIKNVRKILSVSACNRKGPKGK